MTFSPTPDQQHLLELVGAGHDGVLATLKRDGTPQLSNITYLWDAGARTVRISVTADRAKSRNLQRDPRASLHVTSRDFGHWTVVSGTATVTPVAADPHDDVVEALVELYRGVHGEHPDWDDYRAVMVRDQRQLVTIAVEHVYGQA